MTNLFWIMVGSVLGALTTLLIVKVRRKQKVVAVENLVILQKMVDAALIELDSHIKPMFDGALGSRTSKSLTGKDQTYDFLILCHAYAYGWLERYFEAKLWHLRSTKYADAGMVERLTRVASTTWANSVSGAEIAGFIGEDPKWFAASRLLMDNDVLFSKVRRSGYEGELQEFRNVALNPILAGKPLVKEFKNP